MDTEICRVEADDWEVLRDVRLAALADAPYAFMATLTQEQDYGKERWREWIGRSAFFLAWDRSPARNGSHPVGIVGTFSEDGAGWHVFSMWVTPAARGTGVAGQLIDAVVRHASTRGAPTLTLWVTDVNDRARAFYERLGFRGTGKRQPVRPETPDDWEEEMSLSLSANSAK